MSEREGANYKSGCGLHPSTPPKHPQAASLAVLQLHVWGSTLCVFPSFTAFFHRHQRKKQRVKVNTGLSSWSRLKDNPHHWLVHHSAVRGREWQIFSSLSGGKKEWGVSDEGERREVERRGEPQWNFTGRSAQWNCINEDAGSLPVVSVWFSPCSLHLCYCR